MQAAVELGLEDGQKLRVDTTVVQTDVQFPTDSTLLWDAIRVVTRLMGELRRRRWDAGVSGVSEIGRDRRGAGCKSFNRSPQEQRQDQQTATYRELIGIAEEVVEAHEPHSSRPVKRAARHYHRTGYRELRQADRALLRSGRPCD